VAVFSWPGARCSGRCNKFSPHSRWPQSVRPKEMGLWSAGFSTRRLLPLLQLTINMWLPHWVGLAYIHFDFVVLFFFLLFQFSSAHLANYFALWLWPLNPVWAGSSHSFGCGGYGHKWPTCIRTSVCSVCALCARYID